VQINQCHYAQLLPRVRANYVFLTNAGSRSAVSTPIMDRLLAIQGLPVFHNTRLTLPVNPNLYALKKFLLRVKGNPLAASYDINRACKSVSRLWPKKTVSFRSSYRLESKLLALGMPRSSMPSTGIIAYDWYAAMWRIGIILYRR
jgi:hypothetical protein